jgi:hypothetical protein
MSRGLAWATVRPRSEAMIENGLSIARSFRLLRPRAAFAADYADDRRLEKYFAAN